MFSCIWNSPPLPPENPLYMCWFSLWILRYRHLGGKGGTAFHELIFWENAIAIEKKFLEKACPLDPPYRDFHKPGPFDLANVSLICVTFVSGYGLIDCLVTVVIYFLFHYPEGGNVTAYDYVHL